MAKRIAFLLFCLCSFGLAQEVKIGDSFDFDVPFGTKLIDVGFSNNDFVNTSTVNETDFLLLRWHGSQLDSASGFKIYVGVPKFNLVEVDFGLTPLEWFSSEQMAQMNFISPQDIGNVRQYLLRVAKFDWVVQVAAYDATGRIIDVSQVRYVRQKRDK